ncbi:putative TetR family transcriptional regulator [Actinacidiphila reveromycinica]|uniref:Putative TetR family transcriptional regulator n=1 Tax=Actinacidiphila reveromycinica TaxID=659352 RepID=A0A7U3UP67_9ACTN|nr:TetR/AcrR family transcriptional regulator [Streptomyces sp. SN-593]BBA96145.1 putative TetR family transcriptional regulator [Streptomyces sp. SN-593]
MAEGFKRRTPSQWGEGAVLKAEILAAAARLLAASGREDAVSLRAVAREVGISAPSIYLHFKDRSDLVAAVTQEAYATLLADLRATWDREAGAGPLPALRAMARRYCGFALENPTRYRLMFGLERVTAPREQSPQHPVWLLYGAWQDAVAACRTARPCAERDRKDALLLWSALHGIVAIAMALPFETDREGIARRADDLFDRVMAE